MRRAAVRLAALLLAATCAGAAAAPPDVVQQFAPDGTLLAAINYGNPVLAQRTPAEGAPHGVSAELARALGRELGVPVRFVTFDEAGRVSEALRADPSAWDVAFLAIDPVRAEAIDFTAPYVEIEGSYLVPADSPLHTVAEVDRPGVRIAVAQGSAYDLYLTRALRHAQLVRLPSGDAATEAFRRQHLDALAGVKQPLAAYAAAHPDVRLMPGRFMAIDQAMAVPKGRPAAAGFLRGFVERMKRSGLVGKALADTGQSSATVAPPAP